LETWLSLGQLATSAVKIKENFFEPPDKEISWWAEALARQCQSALDELTFLAPWLVLPASAELKSYFSNNYEIPTLRELTNLNTKLLPVTIHQLSP